MSRRPARTSLTQSAPVIGYIDASVPATDGNAATREIVARQTLPKLQLPDRLQDYMRDLYWNLTNGVFVNPTLDPVEIHKQLDCATYEYTGFDEFTLNQQFSSINYGAGFVLLNHPFLPIVVHGRLHHWFNLSKHEHWSRQGLAYDNATLYNQFISDNFEFYSTVFDQWEEFPFYVEVIRVYWRGQESELSAADRCWCDQPTSHRQAKMGFRVQLGTDGTFYRSHNNRAWRLYQTNPGMMGNSYYAGKPEIDPTFFRTPPEIQQSFDKPDESTMVWHSTDDLGCLPLTLTAADGTTVPFPPSLAVDENFMMMNPYSLATSECNVFYTQSENLQENPYLTSQTPPPELAYPVTSFDQFRALFGETRAYRFRPMDAQRSQKSTLTIVPARYEFRRNWLLDKTMRPTNQQLADVLLDYVAGYRAQ